MLNKQSNRAMTDSEKGLVIKSSSYHEEALEHFAQSANGDMRAALNGLNSLYLPHRG